MAISKEEQRKKKAQQMATFYASGKGKSELGAKAAQRAVAKTDGQAGYSNQMTSTVHPTPLNVAAENFRSRTEPQIWKSGMMSSPGARGGRVIRSGDVQDDQWSRPVGYGTGESQSYSAPSQTADDFAYQPAAINLAEDNWQRRTEPQIWKSGMMSSPGARGGSVTRGSSVYDAQRPIDYAIGADRQEFATSNMYSAILGSGGAALRENMNKYAKELDVVNVMTAAYLASPSLVDPAELRQTAQYAEELRQVVAKQVYDSFGYSFKDRQEMEDFLSFYKSSWPWH